MSRLQPHGVWPILCALTPVDPNGGNTDSHMSDAQLVMDVLLQQGLQQPPPNS